MDFDMNVDYDTLCIIEEKLKKINNTMYTSTQKMIVSLQEAQEFLAGNQFEKAQISTSRSIDITNKVMVDIFGTLNYIEELKNILEEYSKLEYKV